MQHQLLVSAQSSRNLTAILIILQVPLGVIAVREHVPCVKVLQVEHVHVLQVHEHVRVLAILGLLNILQEHEVPVEYLKCSLIFWTKSEADKVEVLVHSVARRASSLKKEKETT